MITGKIKLLFIGRKGKLERDIKKISRVKKKEIEKSFKGKQGQKKKELNGYIDGDWEE